MLSLLLQFYKPIRYFSSSSKDTDHVFPFPSIETSYRGMVRQPRYMYCCHSTISGGRKEIQPNRYSEGTTKLSIQY